MKARRWTRRYPFKGSLKDYAVYLEQRVHDLETERRQVSSRLAALNSAGIQPQGTQKLIDVPDGTNLIFDIQTQESQKFRDEQRPPKRRRENVPTHSAQFTGEHCTDEHQLATSTFALELETDPQTQQLPINKKKKKKKSTTHAATLLLAHASGDKVKWAKTREATMFSTPDTVIRAYRLFILRPMDRIQEDIKIKVEGTVSSVLESYQAVHEFLLKQSNLASQLCNFGDLICYCVCAVARSNGASVDQVDKLQNALLPHRCQNSKQAARLRTVAVWTASLIDALEAKVGYRASQLFVMCRWFAADSGVALNIDRWSFDNGVSPLERQERLPG